MPPRRKVGANDEAPARKKAPTPPTPPELSGESDDSSVEDGGNKTVNKSKAVNDLQNELTAQRLLAKQAKEDAENQKAMVAKLQDQLAASAATDGSRSSGVGSDSGGAGCMDRMVLNEGKKTTLSAHVTAIFGNIKFLNTDTLDHNAEILEDAMEAMGVLTAIERAEFTAVTKRELKYLISQKRSYAKKTIMKKYYGKEHLLSGWPCFDYFLSQPS